MKLLLVIIGLLFAVNLYAVLNSGAEVAIVKAETAQIKAKETEQIRKKWSPTRTETPNGKVATPTPTMTATPAPASKATATPGK